MSTRTTSILAGIAFAIGFILALFVKTDGCGHRPPVDRVDTIIVKLPIVIPSQPKIIYRPLKEIQTVVDTLKLIQYLTEIDSFLKIDTVVRQIPVNLYIGSVDSGTVKLDYEIETIGFLTKFNPTITYKPVRSPERHWIVGVGVSDRLNWKASLGRSGWLVEAEFGQAYRFNQVYLTKQFNF